jgi:hypothetical protein
MPKVAFCGLVDPNVLLHDLLHSLCNKQPKNNGVYEYTSNVCNLRILYDLHFYEYEMNHRMLQVVSDNPGYLELLLSQ